MADQLNFNPIRALDANGNPVSGAEAYFFASGTTTPVTVYTDSGLGTAHPSPLEAGSSGVFALVFNAGAAVKVDVRDPDTAASLPGFPMDPVFLVSGAGSAADDVSFSPVAGNAATNVQDAIENDVTALALKAPIASPTFTGTPAAPTATLGTNTTQIATTAFALAQVIDEDTFATDSATRPPSQQSAKAYIAAQIAAIPAPSTGCTFLSTADLASDATADFTLTAGYDAYMFMLQNVVPVTDDVHFWLRTSTDGGANFDAGTGYQWALTRRDTASGTSDSGGSVAAISITGDDASTGVGSTGSESISGTVTVYGPSLAINTYVTWVTAHQNSTGNINSVNGAGVRTSAADVDAIRFLFSSGNLESGTITLYGFKNA